MFTIRYVQGHVNVYDLQGVFLFSADNECEARKEIKDQILALIENQLQNESRE